MSINKNDLDLLSAGYLAAAHNDQDELRKVATKMARRYGHWINILETGAKLSLVFLDLGSEHLHSEPVKWMIGYIGWQGHKTTYSRLNIALVTLRGNEDEIRRLKGTNTKGEVVASLLTVVGQVIFREHEHSHELYEKDAQAHALNALETAPKRVRVSHTADKWRSRRASGTGFFDQLGSFLVDIAGDVADILT